MLTTKCFIFVADYQTNVIGTNNNLNKDSSMELEILESKKGTKVVSATNLYHVLKLPMAQYSASVRRWLRDLYEFSDGGIRKPQVLRDYARRPRPGEPLEDYYITLELAKLIALRTTSKVKLKYARILDTVAHNGQMSLFVQAA